MNVIHQQTIRFTNDTYQQEKEIPGEGLKLMHNNTLPQVFQILAIQKYNHKELMVGRAQVCISYTELSQTSVITNK
jgi:hypothetical protein